MRLLVDTLTVVGAIVGYAALVGVAYVAYRRAGWL